VYTHRKVIFTTTLRRLGVPQVRFDIPFSHWDINGQTFAWTERPGHHQLLVFQHVRFRRPVSALTTLLPISLLYG
jgi:hypothetical protein